MLILTAALLATFSAFFNPAKNVAIRMVVPDEHNLQAQSLSSTVSVVVGLGAPVLAAVLISYSMLSVFLLDADSFFVSLLFRVGLDLRLDSDSLQDLLRCLRY